jgi:hypothetical protein
MKVENIKHIILVVLIFISYESKADIAIISSLDTNSILIGEQTTLNLKVTASLSDQVELWPAFRDTLVKGVEIVSVEKIDTLLDIDNNIKSYSQSLIITSFDSGYYAIPPAKFTINEKVLESQAQLLTVLTLPIDTANAKIYDIKPPIDTKFGIWDWILYNKLNLLGILLLIGLIILLIYLLTKKQNIPVPKVIKPKVPAHIIALEKLNQLADQKLWQNNKTKLFYISISEILREYLENRYKILALEQTTEEIMMSIKYFEIEEISRSKLRQVLMLSDLVKFAKENPLPNENEASLNNAFEFVHQTAPVETKEIDQ